MSSGLAGRMPRIILLALICTGLCLTAAAQSTTEGAIGGTVYDPSGAVVPNAAITVTNNGTNAQSKVVSDASGAYRVIRLQPATYTVSISAAGFANFTGNQVIVEVGRVTELSPHLTVGNSVETVDVSAELPQVNTTSSDFAPVVNQTSIQNLPINNGRWSTFTLLTPGVVNDSNGFGLVSFRGMSTLLNNNTVDGADNNQAFFSEERGRTRAGYSTPKTAIREFQANTSNYSAEYGRSAGGVVNTVTKSGTNTLHGEMYFTDRDNNWGSINPFTRVPVQTSPGVFAIQTIKPKDWRKIAGASLGGPIIKDKLFFFFTFDWYFHNFPGVASPSNATNFFAAPTAASIQTLATNLGTTTANAATVYNNGLAALATTLGTVPRTGEQYIMFPKIDWQINKRNTLAVSVNRMRWASPAGIQTQTNNTRGIASFGDDYVKDTWGVAKLSTLVTNNIANEFRVQYGRDFEFEFPQQPTPYEQTNLVTSPLFPGYVNPFGLPPDMSITNGWNIGVPTFLTRPKFPDETRQQYADTVSLTRGNHTLKFGMDYTHVHDISQNLASQFGSYSYTNLVNFITDFNKVKGCRGTVGGVANTPVGCYSSYQQAFGPLGFEFGTNDYAWFAQDDWRIKPRLTLSLGLRWEYEQLPSPFSNLVNPAVPQTSKFPADKNNFGPRIGFAWDIFGKGRTSLRGGWGMYYGRVINSTIFSALTSTGITGGQFNFTGIAPTSVGAPSFPQILLTQPTTTLRPSISFFDSHFQLPQIHQIDLTLEHDLGWNTVMSFSYLGALGRQLPSFIDTNISPSTTNITYTVCGINNTPTSCGQPGAGQPIQTPTVTVPLYNARPVATLAGMGDIVSRVTSNYHALAFQLNHRMSRHVQFGANFTWSHALDFGVNNQTFSLTNSQVDPFNLRADYGNSLTNVPHRFVFHAVGESPWHVKGLAGWFANDWQLAPIFQWQNGLPYSVRTSGNAAGGLSPGGGGINGSGGDFRVPGFARNLFQMPNTMLIDLKLAKRIAYRERYSVELSGEAYNLMNHFNVTGVNTTAYFVGTTSLNGVNTPTLTFNSGVYGTPTNANSNFAYSTRQIQLGVKVRF